MSTELKAQLQGEMVRPRTLVIKPLPYQQGPVTANFAGVYGGQQEDVWVATFLDPDEADAWVKASQLFGQPIKGVVLGTRGNGGSAPAQEDVPDRGSSGEVPGFGEGRTGSPLLLPDDALLVPSRD